MDGDGATRARRDFLAAAAGAGAVGLAGCIGSIGGGGDQCERTDEPTVNSLPAPVIGDPNADVTVQSFEDFACPHCATYALEAFPAIRSEYVDPGKVRYEHHDFPIPVSEKWSWEVASAARGVQDETDAESFYAFSKRMFESQDGFSYQTIRDAADAADAPGCAVVNDARNGTYRPVVEADRELALQKGAQGTPTVFVNGRSVEPTASGVGSAIEAALRG